MSKYKNERSATDYVTGGRDSSAHRTAIAAAGHRIDNNDNGATVRPHSGIVDNPAVSNGERFELSNDFALRALS